MIELARDAVSVRCAAWRFDLGGPCPSRHTVARRPGEGDAEVTERAVASALAGSWKSHWMPWCPGCHARFEETWKGRA